MLFSTYRVATVVLYVVIMGLIVLFLAIVSPGLALGFAFVFALIGLLGFAVNFALIRNRLNDYGGRIPMPNAGLGLLGVDIVDDDTVGDDTAGRTPRPSATVSAYDGNEIDPTPFLRRCPYCHAPISRPDAKYCDECGKPLSSNPDPEGVAPPMGR